jgi:hypothetical protein
MARQQFGSWVLSFFMRRKNREKKNEGANETNILLTKMSKNPLNYWYFLSSE